MCAWYFKDKVKIDKEFITADSRKFEYLVCDYLNACFPLEHWQLTSATRDGNRDMEAGYCFMGESMWAEAKYTANPDKSLSSRKYDSTLVSAKMEDNVIKIFFVTNSIIGTHLIERVSTYCHLIHVNEVQFVGKNILEYWIAQHQQIQDKYFQKWPPKVMTEPIVYLKAVRIFHQKDSYTIDTLLENQRIMPLYSHSNYIFECEIEIVGYEDKTLNIRCEDEVLHDGIIHSGIYTFNLANVLSKNMRQSLKEYTLHFYYSENSNKANHLFGSYKITLSDPITFYRSQQETFDWMMEQLKMDRQLIYNLYGQAHIGKSWLLERLQEELVGRYDDNSKTIYITFHGSAQDIVSLCRIIFTLIFDYYNLGISSDALDRYCQSISERNSIFSYDKIKTLIEALKNDNYQEAEAVLLHCMELDDSPLFDYLNCFAWRKVYIIDNVHLLNGNGKRIFMNILESFQVQKQVIFILSSRQELSITGCHNRKLLEMNNEEILSLLKNVLTKPVQDLTEILPDNHLLSYPLIMERFLSEIKKTVTPSELRDYYATNFSNTTYRYLETEPSFFNWTAALVVIFLVETGVDSMFLMEIQPQSYWLELIEQDIIVLNQGEYCPNFIVSDKELEKALNKHKDECEKLLFRLLGEADSPTRYRNILFKYYPQHYNKLWKEQYEGIQKNHELNCYQEVRELCKAVLIHKNYFRGPASEMRLVKYLQAFSYMHCNSSREALPLLQNLIDEYKNIPTDALYYTVYSEIIDAKYWEWSGYDKMEAEINAYRKQWTANSDKLALQNRAYLTATNRMMVYFLAEDKLSSADKWMHKNLKLAVKFHSVEHAGYTLMDYAKGIYHIDLKKALIYLYKSEEIFIFLSTEQRRLLDCRCEIAFVRSLLGVADAQELKDAATALYQNQYWIQYYKSKLKLICVYLKQHNMAEAKKYLTQAKNAAIISNSVRCRYLMSIFELIIDTRLSPDLLDNSCIPKSYRKLRDHNRLCDGSNFGLYQKEIIAKTAYLDPRVW